MSRAATGRRGTGQGTRGAVRATGHVGRAHGQGGPVAVMRLDRARGVLRCRAVRGSRWAVVRVRDELPGRPPSYRAWFSDGRRIAGEVPWPVLVRWCSAWVCGAAPETGEGDDGVL